MKPQDLRDLIGRMTAGPWSVCGADRGGCECGFIWAPDGDTLLAAGPTHDLADIIPVKEQVASNAVGLVAIRNLAPALVDLWEAVERARAHVEQQPWPNNVEGAHPLTQSIFAAAKRVGA